MRRTSTTTSRTARAFARQDDTTSPTQAIAMSLRGIVAGPPRDVDGAMLASIADRAVRNCRVALAHEWGSDPGIRDAIHAEMDAAREAASALAYVVRTSGIRLDDIMVTTEHPHHWGRDRGPHYESLAAAYGVRAARIHALPRDPASFVAERQEAQDSALKRVNDRRTKVRDVATEQGIAMSPRAFAPVLRGDLLPREARRALIPDRMIAACLAIHGTFLTLPLTLQTRPHDAIWRVIAPILSAMDRHEEEDGFDVL